MVWNLNPAKLVSGLRIGGDYSIGCVSLPVEHDETGAGRYRLKFSRAKVQNARVWSGPSGPRGHWHCSRRLRHSIGLAPGTEL
jgi:hypothetical protein